MVKRRARRPAVAGAAKPTTPKKPQRPQKPPPAALPEPPRTFHLGTVAGATTGKWIDTWKERMPHVPIEVIPLDPRAQLDRLATGSLDAALVRLPVDGEAFHVIRLYDETPVVVAAADSHLMAAEELAASDLEGETLFVPADDVLGTLDLPGTIAASGPQIEHTADAIATAASGVGIVIVPMSLARLHHRKDADYRPLRDGPASSVALVWPQGRTTADVETFVGIVRGRTARSSR